jgi:N-acetylglucosamine kinase-like BadF-type ATPase
MGQVLHGSARTKKAVRRAIQHTEESLGALARRPGVNPKTIEQEAVVIAVAGIRSCRSTTAYMRSKRQFRN